jgi:hypothetical protein
MFTIIFNLPSLHFEIHFNIICLSIPSIHCLVAIVTGLRAGRLRNRNSISFKNQRFSSSSKYLELFGKRPTLLYLISLFSMGKGSRHVKLNILLHSVQTLRMSGTIPLLLPITSWCTQKQIRTLLLGLSSCLFASIFLDKTLHGLFFPSLLATHAAYRTFSI